MAFQKLLDEALKAIPLASIDDRLDSPSKLKRIKSRLKRSTIGQPEHKRKVPDVNVNLKRDKVPLSDSVLHEAEMEMDLPVSDTGENGGSGLDSGLETSPSAEMDLEVTDKDIPAQEGGAQGGDIAKTAQIVGQATGQLDGIVKQLMELSGYYPEQDDKKHKLTEISERLSEISMVLNRDFLNG
jgi:hypothetical protein